MLGNWTWLSDMEEGGRCLGKGESARRWGQMRYLLGFPPWLCKDLPYANNLSAKTICFSDLWQCPELVADLPWLSLGLTSHIPENMTLAGRYKNRLCNGALQHSVFLYMRRCTYMCIEKIKGWQEIHLRVKRGYFWMRGGITAELFFLLLICACF